MGRGVQCHLAWGPAGVLGSICGLHLWLALVWPAVRCQLWAEPASSICPVGLSLLSSLGLTAGADGPPDEPDGCLAAQPGHEHLGTDHLPAGHLPRLGQHPRCQRHRPATSLDQQHGSNPLSPAGDFFFGWAFPTGLLLSLAAKILQADQAILSCNPIGGSKRG